MVEYDYNHDGDGTASVEVSVEDIQFYKDTFIIIVYVNGKKFEFSSLGASQTEDVDAHVTASGTIDVEPPGE